MELFPDNRPNLFKTKLYKELTLGNSSEEWEVALIDIQYPQNWPNILETTQLAFIVELDKTVRQNERLMPGRPAGPMNDFDGALMEGTLGDSYYDQVWHTAIPFELTKGHYDSVQELGGIIETRFRQSIQPLIEKATGHRFSIEYSYDRVTGISRLLPHGSGTIHVACTNPYIMETIFAFPLTYRGKLDKMTRETAKSFASPLLSYRLPLTSTRHSTLETLSSMYVYSDLAQYQIIGDTQAPLLGIVPIQPLITAASSVSRAAIGRADLESTQSPNDQQYYAFNPAYYIPLRQHKFQSIEIQLNTDWGAPFPFAENMNSRVCCRLQFRKRAGPGGPRIFL